MKNIFLFMAILVSGSLSCTENDAKKTEMKKVLELNSALAKASDTQFDDLVNSLNSIAAQLKTERPYPLNSLKIIYASITEASLARPPQWYPGPAWMKWIEESVEVMEAIGRLDQLHEISKKVRPNGTAGKISLAIAVCKYERIHGKFHDCTAAVNKLRSTVGKEKKYELTLVESLVLLEVGNHTSAMSKLNSVLDDQSNDAKEIIPWANLLAAYVQTTIPDLPKAKIYLDTHFRLLEAKQLSELPPLAKYFALVTEITYFRELGNLELVKEKSQRALSTLDKEINGTPMVKTWLILELIVVAAQNRNTVELKSMVDLLRTTVAELPDYTYTLDYIPAFEAALVGSYKPAMLNNMRKVIGKNNPPLRRMEYILNKVTLKN